MSWLHDRQKREKWIRFVRTLNPDLDDRAVSLMDELVYVSRSIYLVGEQSLAESGLSLAQYKVLMHLLFAEQMGDRDELNPSEISDRQGVSRNTISALIRNLEKSGLVERRLDPDDRRRFYIGLTDDGRALVTDHARQHLTTIGGSFSGLEPDEQETLYRLLRKVGVQVEELRQ